MSRAGGGTVTERVVVRPMRGGDVEAAWHCGVTSLAAMAKIYEPAMAGGFSAAATTPNQRERGCDRVRHLLRQDPGGAWVAVDPAQGDQLVGVALGLRRADLWFLSLLAVDTDYQSGGVGRRLLDAALSYAEPTDARWILSSADPKALRRYHAIGLDLHPGFLAAGQVYRPAIPAGLGVRDGDWDRDGDLIDEIVTGLRGAPYGPDREFFRRWNSGLKVVDGQGYLIQRPAGVLSLGATTPDVGRRLLWAALAEADRAVELEWLDARQQWAIDVAHEARLSLLPGPSSCYRELAGPMTPFIASGAYG